MHFQAAASWKGRQNREFGPDLAYMPHNCRNIDARPSHDSRKIFTRVSHDFRINVALFYFHHYDKNISYTEMKNRGMCIREIRETQTLTLYAIFHPLIWDENPFSVEKWHI